MSGPPGFRCSPEAIVGPGYPAIVREIGLAAIAALTAREHPDIALVGLGGPW
jgi:hypothetical protein